MLELIYRYDPYRPITVARPADAEAAIRELVTGNRRLIDQIRHMQQAVMGDDSVGWIVWMPLRRSRQNSSSWVST